MQNGEPYLVPSILLVLGVGGGYLRHPEGFRASAKRSSLS